ncbi:hypothetical protein [Agrococcus baldri]|uniref:CHRD domain-containing protein n=1 Tax=Agrococcus baldri TaxID=153730 RepID=A0AA87RHR2_9MICO|nr:hypothetical protein [Agrococcus baldri]GEK79653.1 hypothetical protein ABA31_10040 [Agrococcus baldri]
MKKTALLLVAPALGIGLVALSAAPAMAAHAEGSYSATLDEINSSGASGEVWIDVEGSEATVTLNASGLAAEFDGAPYPHVQHIHIGAQGVCPDMSADENGDGIISTTEGGPAYGEIGTTLSMGDADKSPAAGVDLMVAPSGDTISYEETFELDQATQDALAEGTAVVVVHGLDPATQPEGAMEPSDLVPELPLAATSPALCGALAMAPAGGVDTGVVTEDGANGAQLGFVAAGATLAAMLAAGVYVARRRTVRDN